MVVETRFYSETSEPQRAERPHDYRSRLAPQEYLWRKHKRIGEEILELDKPVHMRRQEPFVVKLDRKVFEDAGVRFQLYDTLWNQKWEDGTVPMDDRERNLTIEYGRDYFSIGRPEENVKLQVGMNSQFTMFTVRLRTYRPGEDFHNQDLSDAARFYLGQSQESWWDQNGVKRPELSYRKGGDIPYDLYHRVNIRREWADAASLQNVFAEAVKLHTAGKSQPSLT